MSNRFDYNQKKYSLNDFIADFREQIHIKDKNIIIFNPIIIRKKYVIDDYDIVLSDGANISFANRGKLVINSNIKTSSDREKKIIIQSIDGSGIIVFNNKVEFNNVIFQNFNLSNNSTYDQLNYTSPITFINSIANLYNIKFKNILAEDSVNFINSNLDIDELAIYGNKKSDCIDLDFCKGRLSNIIINDCFNDGIDFSFSEIDINGINVSAINDNAISIGENSNIKIKAVSIDKSFLGIAIKDGSSAKINDAYIKNSTYGIAVYRKKNYFLDPQLNISKLNFKNVEKNRQILADKDYQFFLNNEMLSLNKNIEIDFFNEEKK